MPLIPSSDTTPIRAFKDNLKTLLMEKIPSIKQVYFHYPDKGYVLPSIIITTLSISDYLRKIGGDTRIYRYAFSVDIWAKTSNEREELADKVTDVLKDRVNIVEVDAYDISLIGGREIQQEGVVEFRMILSFNALLSQT